MPRQIWHENIFFFRYPEDIRSECLQRPRFSELQTTDPIIQTEKHAAECTQEEVDQPSIKKDDIIIAKVLEPVPRVEKGVTFCALDTL